jgi:hypothetical protein
LKNSEVDQGSDKDQIIVEHVEVETDEENADEKSVKQAHGVSWSPLPPGREEPEPDSEEEEHHPSVAELIAAAKSSK